MSVTRGFSSRCCEPLQSWQQNLVGERILPRNVCLSKMRGNRDEAIECLIPDSISFVDSIHLGVRDLAFPNSD